MRVSSSTSSSGVIVFLILLLSTIFLVVKAEEPNMDEVIPVLAVYETDTDEVAIRVPVVNGTSSKGCPCINVSSVMSSFTSRICTLPTGETGTKLTVDGICVPYSFGSSKCLQHDLLHDPSCSLDNMGETPVEAYCFRPWCYVDASCTKNSYERIYRSDYFSFDSGIDLYYSYSTCNSTADDWLEAKDGKMNDNNAVLNGASIVASVPGYSVPLLYKRDIFGDVITRRGDEYYDNSLLYEGVYINYVKKLLKISNGDIKNISYTYRSKSSSLVHPKSSFTAAVQDIADGLVDISVGPFWITGERLKLAAFTTPVIYDKTFLVVPKPGSSDKLRDQVVKILQPFSNKLWILLVFVTLIAALLSVWFADRSELYRNKSDQRMSMARVRKSLRPTQRKKVFARLVLDAFLEKGTNFFSASVDNDAAASLPNKFLMFGFGFFILITVSAYVANLAAFLTRNVGETRTFEGAIALNMLVCAHPAIQSELQVTWPKANFYFTKSDFHGMLEDYQLGLCEVLAIGWEDTSMDLQFRETMCEMDLVFTDSLIIEIPIAFPVRPELAPGFSYWMYRLERFSGLSIKTEKEEYREEYEWESCSVKLIEEVNKQSDDYAEITMRMMFLPLMLFLSCSILAVLLQVFRQCLQKNGHHSLVGRQSTLNSISNKHVEKDGVSVGIRSLKSAKDTLAERRLLQKLKMLIEDEDEDEDLSLTSDLEKSTD